MSLSIVSPDVPETTKKEDDDNEDVEVAGSVDGYSGFPTGEMILSVSLKGPELTCNPVGNMKQNK